MTPLLTLILDSTPNFAQLRLLAITFKRSTTKIIPQWCQICAEIRSAVKLLKHDVRTCWNSTYDVAESGLELRPTVDHITMLKDTGLHAHKLSEEEWKILEDLCDTFKVKSLIFAWTMSLLRR
jgi:hypothetical protein